MKISRSALLLACIASCFPTGLLVRTRAHGADETPPAARPMIHNVLRGSGPMLTAQTATATEPADDEERAATPSVAPAGPALLTAKGTAATPEVAKKEPATADATKQTSAAPPMLPADDAKPMRNALRDGTSPAAAAPTLSSPTLSTPIATPIKPPVEAKPAGEPKPAIEAPRQGTAAAPGGRTAVISDSPAATVVERRPSANSLLNKDDDGIGTKAEVTKQPVDAATQKLFESTEQMTPLTPEMELLRKRLQSTLATFYHNWTLNTYEHSPWEVMHAIIAYGVDTRLVHNGKHTTAIGHLCFSGISNKLPIVTLRNNELYVLRGPGVQGHSGQFLAILAQSHLQRDYPLYVGGKEYSLEDLIAAEQRDCESGTELTFKLIGLMHYLPSDAAWKNFQGQTWSIDRLVREEIVQPVRGAACGGTHRLMGLSYAVKKREQRGQPIDGIYREAEKYIDQYHKYTFSLQNTDGSFSTAWFVRPEARLDLDRRLQTTGHVLEWLCFSLSDEELRDPRVVRSVKYVTDLLLNEKDHAWEVGHLGHALHALQLYNERVFGGPIRSYEGLVLKRPVKTTRPSAATADGSYRSTIELR